MIRKLLETYLPFFSSLDAGDQEELCFRSFTQCFGKGELIASPDVMCDNIIFVIDGRLKSVLRQERHSILLYYLNPDDICILGSSPLLYGTAAKINIIADMDSRILKVPAQTFNEMKDRYPGMSHFLRRNFMDRFYQLLRRMAEGVEKAAKTSPSGIYLLLKNTEGLRPRGDSLQVGYVMTNGAAVNHVLTDKSAFAPEKGSYLRAVRQVASPLPGADEIRGADAELSLSRYYMITNDRLVTPADVKVFCYNELMTRYGISSDLIHEIRVRDTRDEAREGVGFQTRIYISLKSDPFVKRSFQEKIPAAELALRKMIETRSTNVFPVQVFIEINEIN